VALATALSIDILTVGVRTWPDGGESVGGAATDLHARIDEVEELLR